MPTARTVFRWHAWAYAAGASALVLANVLTGSGWWSFWPLAVWSVAMGVHYLFHKAGAIDEHWVDERTAELRSKSYDASHIDKISERHRAKQTEADKP